MKHVAKTHYSIIKLGPYPVRSVPIIETSPLTKYQQVIISRKAVEKRRRGRMVEIYEELESLGHIFKKEQVG